GRIAQVRADGHEAHADGWIEEVYGECRAVATPLGGRLGPVVAEGPIVIVGQVEANQLTLSVPGEALRDLRHRVVDAVREEADGNAARIAARGQRRLFEPGKRLGT